MTLPAAPPMSMAQMVAEFGIPLPAVFPRDFYGKGGAPAAGNLSFSDFLGRSGAPAIYNPVPGNYSNSGDGSASLTITANRPVIWTWTRTSGTGGTSNVANGASANSITIGLLAGPNGRSAVFDVAADDGVLIKHWTLTLDAAPLGGGGGGHL